MATKTVERPKVETYEVEDLGNIVAMEHVNVRIPDQQIGTLFYFVGMGFTRDPHMMVGLENMWVNVGEEQFHVPTRGQDVLRGHVGIVTPSIVTLKRRLDAVAPKLAGTKFGYEDKPGYLKVTCPWGNELRCYEPSGKWGGIVTGIPYVEFTVPVGAADGIARFYQQALGAPTRSSKAGGGKATIVEVGRRQEIIYRETEGAIPDYDGHHIAIYVNNFSSVYKWLSDHGLVTETPANHQLRFKDIIDPRTGQFLFTIEHEVRSMKRLLFQRPLVNRTPGQFLEPRQVNGRTTLGMAM